jgi:hypothetical protein
MGNDDDKYDNNDEQIDENYLVWLRNYLEHLDVEGKILLKCIRKEYVRWGDPCTGKSGRGESCCEQGKNFGFCKMQEISWQDEELLDS